MLSGGYVGMKDVTNFCSRPSRYALADSAAQETRVGRLDAVRADRRGQCDTPTCLPLFTLHTEDSHGPWVPEHGHRLP
jgi:hypothetical protein